MKKSTGKSLLNFVLLKKSSWALAILLISGVASAQSLTVLSAAAVKNAMAKVPEMFASCSVNNVDFEYGTAGAVRDIALNGRAFDLAILPPKTMAELAEKGLVEQSTLKPLGTVKLGAAVAKGSVLPNMSDVEALKATLLAAESIGIADPGKGATTGIYLAKLFVTLGLDKDIQHKLKFFPDGQNAMEAVARHEVAIGLGQISEAIAVEGLDTLTLLPEASQLKTVYAVAISSASKDKESARNLYDFLLSSDVGSLMTTSGFEIPPR